MRRITSRGSGAVTPLTTGTPGLMIPAFSAAMAASESPNCWVWSKLMLVMTDTRGVQTLVESKPAAQSHLEHGRIHPPPGKMHKRHGGEDLEVGGAMFGRVPLGRRPIQPLDLRPDQLHQTGQLLRRAGPAVDDDPLLDPIEMGRSEQPGAIAGRREHRGDHRRGGAFALGSGDVEDGHALLRVPQPPEQLAHPVELRRLLRTRHRLAPLVVDASGEKPQGGFSAF